MEDFSSQINASRMSGVSSLLSAPPSPHPALPPRTASSPPSLTCCPQLDLSVTFSPAPNIDHAHPRPPESSQRGNQSRLKPRLRGRQGEKSVQQVCFEEPAMVRVPPERHAASSRTTEALRKRRSRKKGGVLKQSAPPSAATPNQHPGCLERAELNTTLHLEAELQSVQGAEFNPQRAVQQTLQREGRTKSLINTRATEVVNIPRSQLLFTSLVSVAVEEDELISQVLQDKLLLAPPPRCHDSREAAVPSLLSFTTLHLLRQNPLPTEEEPPDCRPRPSPRPTHSTFDLYRRHTCWEATP